MICKKDLPTRGPTYQVWLNFEFLVLKLPDLWGPFYKSSGWNYELQYVILFFELNAVFKCGSLYGRAFRSLNIFVLVIYLKFQLNVEIYFQPDKKSIDLGKWMHTINLVLVKYNRIKEQLQNIFLVRSVFFVRVYNI